MKNKKLSIRISEADWQRFHEKAEQADMTLTEYITDCCLGKQIVVIDGLDEVIRQQKAIGRKNVLPHGAILPSRRSCHPGDGT